MTLIFVIFIILLLGGVGLAVKAIWWLFIIALVLVVVGAIQRIGRW